MTAAYQIEPMRMDDYDGVIALWKRTEGISRLETRDEMARFLERNPDLSLVVHCEHQVVAAVLCGHDGRRGYMYHLAVDREHRRHGLAQQMVDRCLAALGRLGIIRCGLQVYRSNEIGLSYWRSTGWKERTDVAPFTHDIEVATADDGANRPTKWHDGPPS